MERIAIIGDTHFARKAEHPLVKKHIKEGQLKYFQHLAQYLRDQQIKTILLTGDLHDTRVSINVEALIQTKRLFASELADFDIHIVLGNHDLYYENSYEISALELYEEYPNVTVYRNSVTKATFLGKNWYIVPWILPENEEKFVGFLEKLATKSDAEKKKTILFGHFEMFGVDMEGNNVSTFGIDPSLFLNACGYTISGHYHGVSTHGTANGSKILYVGSPYPMTFANANAKHGIWIMDENLNMEFVENTISPQFLDVWDSDNLDELGDLSNTFVRFHMNTELDKEVEFEIRLKIQGKKPILIRPVPYQGTMSTEKQKTEHVREANKILAMDTLSLSEIYVDQNSESLPTLKTYDNAKVAILNKVKTYKETINL